MIRSREGSRRVAAAEIVIGVALVVYGLVARIWFAFVVAVLAILFGLFILMRTSGRGGRGSSRS